MRSPSLSSLVLECVLSDSGSVGGAAAAAEAKKRFQRGDWRKRPLPLEWQVYAAQDAFYLPHIARALLTRLVAAQGARGLHLPERLQSGCAALEASAVRNLEGLAEKEVFSAAEAARAALRYLRYPPQKSLLPASYSKVSGDSPTSSGRVITT